MAPQDEDSRQDPESALTVLIQSEGWALFMGECRRLWGSAAVNRKVKDVLKGHPPADHSPIIQAIYGTAEEMQQLVAWPEEEIERLRSKPTSAATVDPFAKHRRA